MYIPPAITLPNVGVGKCGKTVLPSTLVAERTQNNISLHVPITTPLSPVRQQESDVWFFSKHGHRLWPASLSYCAELGTLWRRWQLAVVHLFVTDMHTFVLNCTKNWPFKVILTELVFAPIILAMLIHNLTLQKQTYFKRYIYIYIYIVFMVPCIADLY